MMIQKMITMTKINQIWDELENDKSFAKGLLLRRYDDSVFPNVFVAFQNPEKLLCIAVSVDQNIEVNISSFTNLQEIQVDFFPEPNNKEKNTLLFKLLNNQHKDIFSILCEDLITSIATESNEKHLIKIILNKFEKWKSLFIKIASSGLSPEEQRGLFGELFFLRNFLQANKKFQQIISAWVGSSKEIRDFQMNNWAVEVKTTIGNNHQKVHISSERQLDNTHIENLFLYHVSLEPAQEAGETLNEIVNSIYTILEDDIISSNRFKSKLYEAGYFENHYNLYDSVGYFVRNDTFYKIENDFPRIQENEIRCGVGDIKYSIILSHCEPYKQTTEVVFETLVL